MSEITINQAVERQQAMLAERLHAENQSVEYARYLRLGQYIELLRDGDQRTSVDYMKEMSALSKEFYIPRNYTEACQIMDAGGITYGIS